MSPDGRVTRLLSARTLTLRDGDGALGRQACASRYALLAEDARDPAQFLAARAWRIVPLLERGEATAAELEIEAVARLAFELDDGAYLRSAELLRLVEPLFGSPRGREEGMTRLLHWVSETLDARPAVGMRPSATGLLSELCAAIDDPAIAEILHPVASRWTASVERHRAVTDWESARALAVIAACSGQTPELEVSVERMLEHATDAIEGELLPLTRHGCAVLWRRFDRERSCSLLDAAIDDYAARGMPDEQRRAEKFAAQLGQRSGRSRGVRHPRRLLQEGEFWTLEFDGTLIRLRDSKGLRDLYHLLQRPGRTISALELMNAQGAGAAGRPLRVLDLCGLEGEGLEHWRPVDCEGPDPRALREYAEKVRDLRAELDEASRNSDLGRLERARGEMEMLEDEISRCHDLPTRDARGPWERARKAVTKRIRAEIRTIASHHPNLGSHLDESIRTGNVCSYSPRERIEWSFDGPRVRDSATEEVAALPGM